MDFVEELPLSGKYSSNLVVADRLSKFGYFIPFTYHFMAKQIAKQFVERVVTIHGMPESIITDRDSFFLSGFWNEFV